jgi:protein-tyrosine phosphatase
MRPFVDLHIHLLAGLDDGPKTPEEALEMCALAVEDGTGTVAALAHQGEGWPDVTPTAIHAAVERLQNDLKSRGIALQVYPSAEIMVQLDFEQEWDAGKYLSIGDAKKFVLCELPANAHIDCRFLAEELQPRGLRPIIAHIERYPDLFFQTELLEQAVQMGCLLQINASTVTAPLDRTAEKQLVMLLKRNIVHLIASDAHSARRRHPKLREAYNTVVKLAGPGVADRVFSLNAAMILGTMPFHIAPVLPPEKKHFFARLFGE